MDSKEEEEEEEGPAPTGAGEFPSIEGFGGGGEVGEFRFHGC